GYFGGHDSKFSPPLFLPDEAVGSMFLLVRYRLLTTAVFVCPSTDGEPDALHGWPVEIVNNFSMTDPIGQNYSYSFANPFTVYGEDNVHTQDYHYSIKLPTDFPLGADRNWCANRVASLQPSAPANLLRQMNSRNHDGRGQNVLFNNGSVQWCTTPFVGIK